MVARAGGRCGRLTAGILFYRRLAHLLAEYDLVRVAGRNARPSSPSGRPARLNGQGGLHEAVADVPQQIVDAFYRVRFGHRDLSPDMLKELEASLDLLQQHLSNPSIEITGINVSQRMFVVHARRTRRVLRQRQEHAVSALHGGHARPGAVHSGQVGIATLADPRLDFLAALHKPKKVTPATVEFLDTPGLMPGTHGDNPQRLALIREGDALLIVLGAFAGGDPAADLAAFRDELLFADLSVVTNRAERLEASVKKPRPDREQQLKELEVVKRVLAALDDGKTSPRSGSPRRRRSPCARSAC